jgi:hypothetical protein
MMYNGCTISSRQRKRRVGGSSLTPTSTTFLIDMLDGVNLRGVEREDAI